MDSRILQADDVRDTYRSVDLSLAFWSLLLHRCDVSFFSNHQALFLLSLTSEISKLVAQQYSVQIPVITLDAYCLVLETCLV